MLAGFLVAGGGSTVAEVPPLFRPDAGSLLNQTTPPAAVPTLPASTLPALPDEDLAKPVPDGARVKVSRFVLEGASLLPPEQLQAQLADLVGQELGLSGLREAAARITRFYREQGYFLARAYLPTQDIANGVVRIAVLEGRYGSVEVGGSPRLEQQHARGVLDAQQVAADQPIERASLERSLILLEQRSGAPVQAVMQPGATVGTSHMAIAAPGGPLFSGTLGADNYGNRFTGQGRGTASLALNSPFGVGDRADLWLAYSTGATAVFGSYQVPVGYDGLTLGAAASYYRYDLCCEYAPLDRAGDAAVAGIQARYPLVLRQNAVHYAGLSLERKRLTDTWAGGDLDDKRVNVAVLSFDGISALAAGQVRYRVALTGGDLQIKGPADYIKLNAATIDTAGGYGKLWGQVEFLYPVTGWSFLNLRLSGQGASRNLDSSEKFILGGFNGVRAYPEGEAAGDNAWLARLDWVLPITSAAVPGRAAVRAFVDSGAIWLVDNVRGGLASPGIENHYSLSGAGLGFNWALPRGFALSAYVATAIGDNPGASANGNNADGKSNDTRGWVGAEWAF
jgi:hemolysin activation/secretion protein